MNDKIATAEQRIEAINRELNDNEAAFTQAAQAHQQAQTALVLERAKLQGRLELLKELEGDDGLPDG